MAVDIDRRIGHLINGYSPYLSRETVHSARGDFNIGEFYTPKEGFTHCSIAKASVIDEDVSKLNLINKYVNKKWIPFYLLLLLILIF